MGPVNRKRIEDINEYIYSNMLTKDRLNRDETLRVDAADYIGVTVPSLNKLIKVNWDEIESHPRALEIETKVTQMCKEFPFLNRDYMIKLFTNELDNQAMDTLSTETIDAIRSSEDTPITKYILQKHYTDCTDSIIRYLANFSIVVRNRMLELLAQIGYRCDDSEPRLNIAKFLDEEVDCVGEIVRFGKFVNTSEITMLLFNLSITSDGVTERVSHMWFTVSDEMYIKLSLRSPGTVVHMKGVVEEYRKFNGEVTYGVSRTSTINVLRNPDDEEVQDELPENKIN